ncbi:trigger factor [[Acholeplasma] multilocale]|uniref:trigger factor n=1 Tax=[Acholeplasma] multilocale TaxID=264638 RepID=UPI00047BEBAE|nr:trigger factor [[Acholeplasma] multilocale]
MKFTESKMLEQGQGKWTVTIDGQEWTDTLAKAKNRVKANIEIPGFRKGKAPESEVAKFLTPSKIFNEGFRMSIQPAFEFARAQEVKIEPMNSPEPVPFKVSEQEIIIDFVFDLRPEIELGAYTGIKTVEKETPAVTAEEVEAVITQYQNQFAMEKAKPKTAKIEAGDVVAFDFKGFVDGVAFKGGEAKGHKLTIGSGQFIPGFEDSMIGLGLGEAKIDVKFPEDYTPELAGKDSVFELNITEITSRILPAKDDELAKDLNMKDVNTFAELEAKIKSEILERKVSGLKNQFVNQIIDEIIKGSKIELPKTAIDNQILDLKKQFEQEVQKQGLTMKAYKKATGLTDKQIEAEMYGDAKAKLEGFLVTSEIRDKEKFEATEEQVEAKYAALATQFGLDLEYIKKVIQPEAVKAELMNDLLVDFLYENNGK